MLSELEAELRRLTETGKLKVFHPISSRNAGVVEIRGRRVLDFSSWDFFGLNQETKIKRAIQASIETDGLSSSAARLSSGTTRHHISCEQRLAKYVSAEAALLFSSRNQAVLSLITALAGERDLIVVDELIQSPIVDAAYLSHAQIVTFKLNDLPALERELEKAGAYQDKFLILESLSPVTGMEPDFKAIFELAKRFGLELVVDESLGLTLLGLRGAGSSELLPTKELAHCHFGDLAFGLCGYGAFVAGPEPLLSYILNRSRTFVSENPLPPFVCCTVERAVDLVELKHSERERLKSLALRTRLGLQLLKIAELGGGQSPIISLPFKNYNVAREFSEALFSRGYLVEPVSISVPKHELAAVRIIINSTHSEKNIDDLLKSVADTYPKVF